MQGGPADPDPGRLRGQAECPEGRDYAREIPPKERTAQLKPGGEHGAILIDFTSATKTFRNLLTLGHSSLKGV